MIKCGICDRNFKAITHAHLKSHGLSREEYAQRFGADSMLSTESIERLKARPVRTGWTHSDETKQVMSVNRSGQEPHNKGKDMSQEQKDVLSELAKERYQDKTNHPCYGKPKSEETKAKIRAKRAEQVMGPEVYERIVATRKAKGIRSGMLGKKHTQEALDKMSVASKVFWKTESLKLKEVLLEKAANARLTLISTEDDYYLTLQCEVCKNVFERTKQVFDDCRYDDKICPICHPVPMHTSGAELELISFIRSLIPDIVVKERDRQVLYPKELDIYIPSMNLAIEYCGIYWHSELQGKDKHYHYNKYDACNSKDIRLITIFEDEWVYRRSIVEDRLRHILGLSQRRLYARMTDVRPIANTVANSFLNLYHIQSAGRSNLCYGCFEGRYLVAVMTFSKSNLSRRIKEWELDRFCSKDGVSIIGGASKLFKAFLRDTGVKSVISYADLRWSTGNVYHQLGFDLEAVTPPNYWYFKTNQIERRHRFALRKMATDDQTLTEWQNRQSQGWNRIWDCGNLKFRYKEKEGSLAPLFKS